jgi:hypothetical protein
MLAGAPRARQGRVLTSAAMSSDHPTRACALVTGASSGIGAAFARALHARGERLVLVARRAERLARLAAELGGQPLVVPLDLSEASAPARLDEALRQHGLHVDLLVNNAGSGDTGAFAEQDEARLRAMIEVDVTALVMLTRRALPGMLERGRGRIVNVVSTGAFQPVPFLNVYSACKSFVLSFTEALATEIAGRGVQVQALCPGLTDTEFFEVARTDAKLLVNRLPRLSPEAVVRASLRGLERGRLRVVPGWVDRLNARFVRVLPGALVRRTAAQLYRPR